MHTRYPDLLNGRNLGTETSLRVGTAQRCLATTLSLSCDNRQTTGLTAKDATVLITKLRHVDFLRQQRSAAESAASRETGYLSGSLRLCVIAQEVYKKEHPNQKKKKKKKGRDYGKEALNPNKTRAKRSDVEHAFAWNIIPTSSHHEANSPR